MKSTGTTYSFPSDLPRLTWKLLEEMARDLKGLDLGPERIVTSPGSFAEWPYLSEVFDAPYDEEMITFSKTAAVGPSLLGIPIVESLHTPSWITLLVGRRLPGSLDLPKITILITWNDDYREHLAERFRKKGWRARCSR